MQTGLAPRRIAVVAGTTALVAAGLLLPSSAGAASVVPQRTEPLYYANATSIKMAWRATYRGCGDPKRFVVTTRPRDKRLRVIEVPLRRKLRRAGFNARVVGAFRRAQRFSWRVTLICANPTRRFNSRVQRFVVMPPGPKIQGTYTFAGPLGSLGSWNVFKTDCGGTHCEATAKIGTGSVVQLETDVRRAPLAFRVETTPDLFNCTAANGQEVFDGVSADFTFRPITVVATKVVGGMTVATRIRVRGRVQGTPAGFGQRLGCPGFSFPFNEVGVHRGLRVSGAGSTADFDLSAFNPASTAISLESTI